MKCRESVRVPYVRIELLLAASSGGPSCLVRVSSLVAGTTLSSAPVSTRNCHLETASQTKTRLLLRPATVAIIGDRLCRLPALPGCLPESVVVITQTVVGGRSWSLGFCLLLPGGGVMYGVDGLHFTAAPKGVGSSSGFI